MTVPALLAVVEGASEVTDDGTVDLLLTAVRRAAPELRVVPAVIDVHQPELRNVLESEFDDDEPVVAVPLMLAPGVHLHGDLERALSADPGRPATLAPSLGADEAIVELLAYRLLHSGLGPDDVIVMAAAGSSDHHVVRESVDVGRRLAHLLERYVTVGFLSAAVPRLTGAVDTMRRLHPGSRVAISSYLLSPGRFADAVAEVEGDVIAGPLLMPGRRPPQALVDLVLARYRDGAAQLALLRHP
ncbi:sirohydrochlorin chelatase [Gryllotalpicola protaetiae]|uniref:Cobalamin biosynthesis protein CbiX n=1 Tax=Gryllotalpicola protaetiae TaxID=2419771 RepID=A0A387BDW3_9MICO|nr:CbiX/SirB N-terminal domain-containing protein [Gryllotalpicola protaetiae]AYG02135.1 cobalamin biosynthesis protein CbiX [Gryllotalpicola protaetiae]